MTVDYMAKLAYIAQEMDSIRAQPDAKRGYDVICDAILWSDEYPTDVAGRMSDFDCVKLVQRYRTTVVLGEPDEFLRPYWERAKQLFPNWAGFEPSRILPTDSMVEFYEIRQKRETEKLEKILSKRGTSHGDSQPTE